MPWIKVDVQIEEKAEVYQLSRLLSMEREHVAWKCIKLWKWADAQTEDGLLRGLVLSDLDDVVGVAGFGEALARAGWAIQEEDGVLLPNFERHNGKSAKRRATKATQQAQYRKAQGGAKNDGRSH